MRPKVSKEKRLSQPIYVLLTRAEKRLVTRLARTQNKSRGAILREAFRARHAPKK